jgi:putative ABC transport system substrate-binding protein
MTAHWLFGAGLLVGLATAAANADEPPTRIFHIGIIAGSLRSDPSNVAFEDRLRELGYVEGRNLTIDFVRDNDPDRMAAALDELARRGVDVIALGNEATLKAAVTGTGARSTPVVFRAVDLDPVEKGYVASLAHPGGNLTGIAVQEPELIAKRLDLLTQAVPHIARMVLLYDVFGESQREAATRAASALRIPLEAIELREPPYDYEQALAGTDGARGDAMLITSSGLNLAEPAAQAALRHRLPGIGLWRRWVDAGFLMSYGPNLSGMYRLSADYVDKILKGAKPADLPVQQPTKFELIVNLKTAKALGLTVPLTVLARADEVIE